MNTPHEIVVVPHTHWDREWYLPFQRFRMGLVRMLDEVLDIMAADPLYRFTVDGQLAAVEDYLEIRPERRDDIRRFVEEGRLAVGPWMILADEFLCSGETLIRNLEYGMRGAAALGGAMRVGYLPDQFGHCAQMPQILSLAGLRRACLWRGVPSSVRRDAFAWTGADGSTVVTHYLPGGYGNAVALFSGPGEGLPDRLSAFAASMRPWRPDGPLLAMYGADHSAPAAEITGHGPRVATLEEFLDLAGAPSDLPEVRGELRSHARANILPGVLSARVPIKQGMARAERVLIRYAEPLSALWLADRTASGRLLDLAWRRLIACSGHDSVTGCGADETAQQVAARIAEAEQIGQAVVDLVSATLAAEAPRGALVVVNPSPFERTALVLADLPEHRSRLTDPAGDAVPIQRLEHAPTLLDETVMDDLSQLLGRVHERELFGHEIVSWEAADGVFTITVSRHASGEYAYEDLRRAIVEAGTGPWTVRTLAEPVVTVAAQVTVPPLGRSVLTAEPSSWGSVPLTRTPEAAVALAAPEGTLDNGLLRVTVAGDGTLSLRGRDGTEAHGVGRITHGGDVGDTYNYAPPQGDLVIDRPAYVKVEEICRGPLVSVLEVSRSYEWPAGAVSAEWGASRDGGGPQEGDGSPDAHESVSTVVTTRVELRAGEPFVRCAIALDVRCRDHRLRWHAPLPHPAAESFAEGQFAVVRRGLTPVDGAGGAADVPPGRPAEDSGTATSAEHPRRTAGPEGAAGAEEPEGAEETHRAARADDTVGGSGERPIPTFPAEGFVAAGGFAVLLDHVTEYEVLPAGRGSGTGAVGDTPERRGDVAAADDTSVVVDTAPADVTPGRAELALTLMRSVGYLSRNRNPYRDEPAGPELATPAAQCQGPFSVRFAILPYAGGWAEAELPRLAEEYRHDLLAVPGAGNSDAADRSRAAERRSRAIAVSGEGVVMAALRERDGVLEVRLVAEHPTATEAVIRGDFTAARLADALGSPTAPLAVAAGVVRLPLRPFEIATVHLSA
ncbi:glycoside hydrolase family 38 C-terminal domain-containing protein [Microtetraspora fusca]|uniref:glycoside hydrolase family 38 N-terminal domain-containing protein n=1 Tax=Microtetraspora fusca TaxID=1997 RepID=UPI00082D0F6E|nr:glycoside hydrolase family 38 C-terminal domain-containing protein [Microtetraspora fusca]